MQSLARLYYVLVPQQQTSWYGDTQYLPSGIFDQSPMIMTFQRQQGSLRVGWRLDPWELVDWDIWKYLKDVSKSYFEDNKGLLDSGMVLWKAYKTVVCGQLLSYMIGKKRRREQECWDLERKLAWGKQNTSHRQH